MQTAKSRSISAKLGDGRRRCDTNKSFHPFAPLEVTLAFIDPLITLKLFYRHSQDLHSRHCFHSFGGKDESKIFQKAAACNSSFAFLRRFLQYVCP